MVFNFDVRAVWRQIALASKLTRKLCYRKDIRAMRLKYECPESFLDYLTKPMDIFPKLF